MRRGENKYFWLWNVQCVKEQLANSVGYVPTEITTSGSQYKILNGIFDRVMPDTTA